MSSLDKVLPSQPTELTRPGDAGRREGVPRQGGNVQPSTGMNPTAGKTGPGFLMVLLRALSAWSA
jgi:hypothetical protein